MILALVGGVGGAKLAHGLTMALPSDELVMIVNTGDDFRHLGLAISPDLDTVMYTLAGRANPQTGWGVRDETWSFMEALESLGGETWFRLGDRDLATHIERTRRLDGGDSLSEVTAVLCEKLGIAPRIGPMTDQSLATIVETDEGTLAFQDYFVRRQCAPAVKSVRFQGAAKPSAIFEDALANPDLDAVIIAPSNPYLSIDPILAVDSVRDRLAEKKVVAVSPIIGGQAVKGPAAKIMKELGLEASSVAVARHYAEILDGLVIDSSDSSDAKAIMDLGIRPMVTDTLMRSDEDRRVLAKIVLKFAAGLK